MDFFSGGVYSSDGEFMEDSLVHRGTPAEFQKTAEFLHGTYLYGGCLFAHFGHFVWESLSRLYTIIQCKNYPILFISPNSENGVFTLFFKSLNIKNEIRIVTSPVSVENLIYSSPGSSIVPLFISDEQNSALQVFLFSDNERRGKKIWLSRTKLQYGKLDNEEVIEEGLKKIGYKIIYPELLPLREQAGLISASDVVAGCDGSAFFSLLFSHEVHGKFFVFNRRREFPTTLSYVFQKRNIQFEQHGFELEPVDEEWPFTLFHHPDPNRIIDILNVA
jgi:hypothetical protein